MSENLKTGKVENAEIQPLLAIVSSLVERAGKSRQWKKAKRLETAENEIKEALKTND